MAKTTTLIIALTTAVVIDGEIRKAGTQVEVDETLAKMLLSYGRGTLIESDDHVEDINLSKMTKAQLIEFAKRKYDVDLENTLTKAQLIEAIQVKVLEV